jgi:Protein of unknown function (DUF1761)
MLQHYLSHAPWLQILVAAIAYFALGMIWYMPNTLGNTWAAGHKIDMSNKDEMKKKLPMMMGGTFALNLVMAFGMGLMVHGMQSTMCMAGMKNGLFIGGFVAAAIGINYLYTGKSIKLWLIDAGYHVVGITLMGIILSVWH